MTEDRLVLLGTKGGPSLHSPERMPTASLLEMGGRVCVVDCGLGVTRGIVSAGTHLRDIEMIFLTHLHSDHVAELGALIHTAWTSGLSGPLRLFGPVGTKRCLEGFFTALQFDIELRLYDEGRNDIRKLVDVTEYEEGILLEGGLRVSAMRVSHPPVEECYALRFDNDCWSVSFSSDTAWFPRLKEFAANSDVLVHEAILGKGIDRLVERTRGADRLREHIMASHTEIEDVGRIAKGANVGMLVLHHLVPTFDPEYSDEEWTEAVSKTWAGPVLVGYDGLEIKRNAK